jgi:hypothetical protein
MLVTFSNGLVDPVPSYTASLNSSDHKAWTRIQQTLYALVLAIAARPKSRHIKDP